MDYVARLQVSATQTVWPADEVPSLTANALCPVPETPPLYVSDLLRIDSVRRREKHSPLSEVDRASLNDHWQQCDLPLIDRPMTSDEWVPYLVAFNELPQRPAWADWVFAVLPPRDPNHIAGIARTLIEQEHRARLRKAIDNKDVAPRMAGTLVEATSPVNLQHLVLTRSELVKFCALLCIEVVDAPVTALAPTVAEPVALADEAPPLDDAAAHVKPVGRWRAAEQTILNKLRELGYSPCTLPKSKAWTKGVKSQVRAAIGTKGMWQGLKVFDKAWERLRDRGDIAD